MPRRLPLLAGFLVLAACVPEPAPAPEPVRPIPAPAPVVRPMPAPAPAPAPRPLAIDWRDWPRTPGNWAWRQDGRGSIALYGRSGADADLTIRCDRQRGAIYLSRRIDAGAAATRLTVRTSSQLRSLDAAPTGAAAPYVAAELGVRDPILEAIGFSRGRFVIEAAGQPPLVLPSWPEILRVTEDCRG